MKNSKLALGTVQFGLDYGVSNSSGKVLLEDAVAIAKLAESDGINLYDTAPAYGNSEEVVGSIASSNSYVVTKTQNISSDSIKPSDIEKLELVFKQSLQYLKRQEVYGLLVHSIDDLKKPGSELLLDWLAEKKQRNLVKKLGVSAYSAEDIDFSLNCFDIDIVQLPINIIDQRLIISGHLVKLKRSGVEVHARSIFLQGLLLMNSRDIPSYFDLYQTEIDKFHHYAKQVGLTPLQLSLGYVLNLDEIDRVVIGVNSELELQQIISASKIEMASITASGLFSDDPALLNPALWNL